MPGNRKKSTGVKKKASRDLGYRPGLASSGEEERRSIEMMVFDAYAS